MTTDFHKVLIKDGRIGNLTSNIAYGVTKGGQQITSTRFMTNSVGNVSSQVFNCQIPSHETIIDRAVYWNATVTLKLTSTIPANPGAVSQIINYGETDVLAPFPLHQLCNTMTCQINNQNVTINIRDVLPSMLRLVDDKELCVYDNRTPTAYDKYLNYSETVSGGVNSPFAGFEAIGDNALQPRGAFALDSVSRDFPATAGLAFVAANAAATNVVGYVTFTVSEPLLLSPFIFGNPNNNSGLYGIQNLVFNFTLGDASRVWRRYIGTANKSIDAATGVDTFKVTVESIVNSSLDMIFLTPHPSDLLPSRCITPYYNFQRYISSVAGIGAATAPTFVGNVQTPGTASYTFSSITMNSIPDKLVIFARKAMGTQSYTDSDSFLAIDNISINWNNNAGLLSSHTPMDLYKISKSAGSNQSWHEFRGYGYTKRTVALTTAGAGAGKFVGTSGSMLVIDMGKDLQLVEDFYAPSSIGNFCLQFNIKCKNYGAAVQNVELVCITMNSGILATERGTSSIYQAILSKQDVLEASEQEAISHNDVSRMVGGGFLDKLKSIFSHIHKGVNTIAPIAKQGLKMYSGMKGKHSDTAGSVADVLGQLGYGQHASGRSGGMSASGSSGGSLAHRLR